MAQYEFENVTVPIVIQHIGGDLRLRGREGSRLLVDGDAPQVEQIGEGQPYVINCNGDARVTVPADAPVSIQQVRGDAKLTDLSGPVDIQVIGSDLTLRSVGTVQVKSIGGDLRLKWAAGDVRVEAVGSDATMREVEGAVWVAQVGSDLYLRNVEGNCMVEQVGSDLVLSIDFKPGGEYRFNAGGDVLCRIQPDTSAQFVLPADAELSLDVPAEVTEDKEAGVQIVTLGEGGPTIHLGELDALRLVGEEEDYMISLGIQIEEEVEARLATLEARLSQHLEGIDEQLQERAQRFASQAEKLAERAQQQAERVAKRARASVRRSRRKRGTMPVPPARPTPPRARRSPAEPVSEQERLMILQMVKDNKISIEEAERLLAALEHPQAGQAQG